MNPDDIGRAVGDFAARVAPVVDPATTRECDGYPGLTELRPCGCRRAELEVCDTCQGVDGEDVRDVTLEEALAEVEADEREAFVYLFGCCGDPGDCGTCGA